VSDSLRALAGLVRRETGNDLPEGRLNFLREVAQRRALACGRAEVAGYVAALEAGELAGEWELLASLLTIKESSFFRVPQQWERIRDDLLPELARARAGARRLRFWSAACAAGEEPGTLALLAAESPALAGWDWSILATDLDPDALAQAERGLYGDRAVAAVPAALRERCFRRRGNLWELDPELRARIHYRRVNLARPPWRLPEPTFDLILLRNVLIYFRGDLQRTVVEEVARHLAADGWLFLGGSETLWRVQDRLLAVDLGDCFGYRHRRPEDEVAGTAPALEPSTREQDSSGFPLPQQRFPAASPRGQVASSPPQPQQNFPTPAERLLAAAAHFEADRVAEAKREVEAALAADAADAGAHAFLGLIHDLGGRTDEAVEALRAALYLEPDLVQVRLLLAGCLRRLGEVPHAIRQYREVVATLERGGGRRLAVLDGRLLPDAPETLRRARSALAGLRAG
jgi:chemotaxis protein methyltransferase CheR